MLKLTYSEKSMVDSINNVKIINLQQKING